jgi:hypothetical protein
LLDADALLKSLGSATNVSFLASRVQQVSLLLFHISTLFTSFNNMPVISATTGNAHPAWALARTACEKDDTALMTQAISTVILKWELEVLYQRWMEDAIQHDSTKVLTQLIELGASIRDLRPASVASMYRNGTSKATLELLLALDWDINTQLQFDYRPFIWHFISDSDMISWCLKHGASLTTMDPDRDWYHCPPILGFVAILSTVEEFELLRAEGAPLGWRLLHKAIQTTTHYAPKVGEKEREEEKRIYPERAEQYAERIAMVHHLLDVVGIDVNAPDQPSGGQRPMHYGTPICYIPGSEMPDTDTRELTWLLLNRGADPTPAFKVAELCDYLRFVQYVEDWNAQQGGRRSCSIL